MTDAYPNTELHIAGTWLPAAAGETIDVINPATEEAIGNVAHARIADLDAALEAAETGFREWKDASAMQRYNVMRKAAALVCERADEIAAVMTQEQGKPLFEAKGETLFGAEIIDWFAEEARRAYGWVIPARMAGVTQMVTKEPVGPVAPIMPFSDFDAVVAEANRLDYGLAAYAYTKSAKTAEAIGSAFESGMVSINHLT